MAYSAFDGMPPAVWVCSQCSRLSFWTFVEFHFCHRSVKPNTKRIKREVLSWNGHLNPYHICIFHFGPTPQMHLYSIIIFRFPVQQEEHLCCLDCTAVLETMRAHRHQDERWSLAALKTLSFLSQSNHDEVLEASGCVKHRGEVDGEKVWNGHGLVIVPSHQYVFCDCEIENIWKRSMEELLCPATL